MPTTKHTLQPTACWLHAHPQETADMNANAPIATELLLKLAMFNAGTWLFAFFYSENKQKGNVYAAEIVHEKHCKNMSLWIFNVWTFWKLKVNIRKSEKFYNQQGICHYINCL